MGNRESLARSLRVVTMTSQMQADDYVAVAAENTAIRAHNESLTADVAVYREISTAAIHQLHANERTIKRLRDEKTRLVDENRRLRLTGSPYDSRCGITTELQPVPDGGAPCH